MPENNELNNTIDYRLTNIEKTLSEMKDVMVDQKLINRDLKDVREDQREIINKINDHEKRMRQLENAPVQAKAERWQQIVDMALKAIIAVGLGAVLLKIGIQL